MTESELKRVLYKHARWLAGEADTRAYLRGVDLRGADLSYAYLRGADLIGANLRGTNLSYADLSYANLRGTNLSGTNLSYADLSYTDLRYANLSGANLRGTVLDPERQPNGNVDGFAVDGDYVIGYRTRSARHIDKYRDGRFYSADWFSVCAETECHPGLYLWPSLQAAKNWSPTAEIIRVRTKPSEVHRVGGKWRCRWFEVMGAVNEGANND